MFTSRQAIRLSTECNNVLDLLSASSMAYTTRTCASSHMSWICLGVGSHSVPSTCCRILDSVSGVESGMMMNMSVVLSVMPNVFNDCEIFRVGDR